MKTLLTVILASICLYSNAQSKLDTIPVVNDQYEYQGVINTHGETKDDLYKNAKVFFANTFKSSINVIQYDDRTEGKIIGKGFFHVETNKTLWLTPLLYKWDVYFTIQLECKDGRYRYTLYDFNIKQQIYNGYVDDMTFDMAYTKANKGAYKKIFTDLINESSGEFNATISSLNAYMHNKATIVNNNDF